MTDPSNTDGGSEEVTDGQETEFAYDIGGGE